MPSTAAKAVRMTKKDMEKYRRLLEEKKASLSAELAKTRSAEEETSEEVDAGHRRQGRFLVHPRVPLLADRRRALDPAPDRRGPRPDRRRHVRPLRQLRPADGREAPHGGSLGPVLRRLPGARREGDAPELSPQSSFARGAPSEHRGGLFCGSAVRLRSVPKAVFSDKAVPGVRRRARRRSWSTGDVEFFVEEAAGAGARDARRKGRGGPALRGRRTGRVGLGRAAEPLALLAAADRRARHLAAARHRVAGAAPRQGGRGLGGPASGARPSSRRGPCWRPSTWRSDAGPEETAEAAARKVRSARTSAPLLAEILKELPEEKGGGAAVLRSALRSLLARDENDGTVALLTARRAAGRRRPREGDRGARPGARDVGRRRCRAGPPAPGARRARRSARSSSIRRRSSACCVRTDSRAGGLRAGAREAPRVGGQGRAHPGGRHRVERRGRVFGGRLRPLRRDRPARRRRRPRAAGAALRRARRARRATGSSARSRTSGRSSSSACSPARSGGCCSSGRGSTKAGATRVRRVDVLPDVPGPRPAAPDGAGGAVRAVPVRVGAGRGAPLRPLQVGPALLEVHDAAARAGARARRRRRRGAQELGAAARDALGLRRGARRGELIAGAQPESLFEVRRVETSRRPKTRGAAASWRRPVFVEGLDV